MTLTLIQLSVYVAIAIVIAYLAGRILKSRYPYGFVGAFVASLVGEWLMIDVFQVLLAPEVSYEGVPLITGIVGALFEAFLWAWVAGGQHHHRWV
ncbi:MAG: GlsB/YeaQ/YmgE family stress response membrane protein [Chloroflexi bacterium]|nr:GlsB/YeaQ/YmgE family stress response membrane protein [Chloroflexota bacterium]